MLDSKYRSYGTYLLLQTTEHPIPFAENEVLSRSAMGKAK